MAGEGDLIGAVLVRRYRLTRRLGEGGMGLVFAAEDTQTGRSVAVKMLRHEFLHNAQVSDRFLEEARMGQRLAHPNIIAVYDVQRAEDQTPFFVMELLDGAPLSAYLLGGAKLPLPQAASILLGILSGLGAAHAGGIVHRDLKPENVYLARTPEGVVAKILDFGIAKVMDAAGGMGSRTQTGMLLGTPAYMSPEQIRNSKDVDARSDLFGAGVLFYEMLAGRPAFGASNEFAKLTAVLTTEPEPIERLDPALGPVSPFLARALAKDRNLRFQTADEMAGALKHALGGPNSPFLSRMPPGLSGGPPPLGTIPPGSAKSGTLASAPSAPVKDGVPLITIEQSNPGLARLRHQLGRQTVPAWVAAVLVSAALFFGFLIGFAVARSM
jgi:serine/threonine-protein kinase